MAKGNMLQGMARGKVGDVVFSRLDGEQISRVRNRHPRNPRSNGQLYQRAIMATVMQAYAAGKKIFDHAFEAYEFGAKNQRRFLSLNAKALREAIAADIAGSVATASQEGRVVAPGIKSPVPYKYIVSEGSLTPTFLANKDFAATEATGTETVAQMCAKWNITAGDIFTFVIFSKNTNVLFEYETTVTADAPFAKQFEGKFDFIRFTVKDVTSTANYQGLTSIFDVESTISSEDLNIILEEINTRIMAGEQVWTNILTVFNNMDKGFSSVACIRSKVNSALRSSATMDYIDSNFGLATQYALAAWQQGTVLVGDSDLILEGGEGGNVL